MPPVRVLPPDLVNQIAAGEVVERPASVVKELVENALDAGATRIEVAIEGGGVPWLEVGDDGCGMSRSDAELAFERHATSKIEDASDLARVETLGFRGEALPSIASVAAVRMRTQRAEDRIGVELVGEGAGIREVRELACPEGTRVEVSELFARVPARRKFLKTPMTEGTHVVRALERIALARPDVRFSLDRDGRSALRLLATSDLRERAIAVLPGPLGERLRAVSARIPNAEIIGFATPSDVWRGTTGDIHLLVNARPVRDRLLLRCVREAYQDALPPGRHPAAVLYLRIDPEDVDVNVHPTKAEVRFRDPRAIGRLVREALVRAIGRGVAPKAPRFERASEWGSSAAGEPVPPADFWLRPPELATPEGPTHGSLGELSRERPAVPFAEHRYLGQALASYLILESEDGLLLLDQHAAHERVLFERLREQASDSKVERQALLIPIWDELARSAADALAGGASLLERAGFEIEVGDATPRGGVRVGLRAIPALLTSRDRSDWGELLSETAAALLEPEATGARDGLEGALHGVLASAACHAAVRQGDPMNPREVRALLEALDATVWFPNCPHGRPLASAIPRSELERRFRRQ